MISIRDLKNHTVNEGDILIHKQIQEGEKFPSICYHTVENRVFKIVDNKKVKQILANNLVNFIKLNNILPYGCKVSMFYKNGSAKVDYIPSEYDKFALRILPKIHNIPDMRRFFDGLNSIWVNPIHGQESSSPSSSPKQTWQVGSSSDPNKFYTVSLSKGNWSCSCPQFRFRKQQCKHIDECLKKRLRLK